MQQYLTEPLKANQLLEKLPENFTGERRANSQRLFLGALRYGHQIQAAIASLAKKRIKTNVRSILLVTGYELLASNEEKRAPIIHCAVEQSKRLVHPSTIGFINAVLRKLPQALAEAQECEDKAVRFSHPDWMIEHWKHELTEADLVGLLAWNQQLPKSYVKHYSGKSEAFAGTKSTVWPQFYEIKPEANWKTEILPLLGRDAFIKDPSTRLAPSLLAPQRGETILDLCAAPGGKSFDLAHEMEMDGRIVAVDLAGSRINRLRENLERLQTDKLKTTIFEADVLQLNPQDFEAADLPTSYDAVMLDAPCSNTGVIQRRTDVKWRLDSTDIQACAHLQKQLLEVAATFVRPGGRIVYSTCSIEKAENLEVVDHFLGSSVGSSFSLKDRSISLPWRTHHDGAAAFLLIRS